MIQLPILLLALGLGPMTDDAAPVVTSITPDKGTIGTFLTIQGDGFGTSQPKVWVARADAPDVTRPFAVYGADHDTLYGAIKGKSLPPGIWLLHIDPQGPAPASVGDATFEAVAPIVDDFQPKHVLVGDTVTLTGQHFGFGKGKVFHGDRRLKVTGWSNGKILARVTKPGKGPLRVESRTADANAPCLLSAASGNLDDTPGDVLQPPSHTLFLGGDLWFSTAQEDLRVSLHDGGTVLRVSAIGSGFGGQPGDGFDPDASPIGMFEAQLRTVPSDDGPWPGQLIGIDWIRVLLSDGSFEGASSWSVLVPTTGPYDVLTWVAGECFVSGYLKTDLVRVSGPGAEVVQVSIDFDADVGRIEQVGVE